VSGKMLGERVAKKTALKGEQTFETSQPKTLPRIEG
jgi:hypothetical protein